MFKRLNNGGVILSDQQIRNCTIRLLDARFNNFLGKLSEIQVFENCVENLTEEKKLAFYDQELILRFFAFKNYRNKYVHDIADYLTEYMEAVSEPDVDKKIPFDYEKEKEIFIKTFTIFDKTLGELSFGFANKKLDKTTGGFSVLHFEAFTLGIQPFLEKIDVNDENSLNKLRGVFEQIKFDPVFRQMTTGGGKNTRGLLQKRIEFVEDKLQENL